MASRGAPVSGSVSASTIELNCLPRRVATVNMPSGTSWRGGTVGENRARPSAVGKIPPAQRCRPPHCTPSPVVGEPLDAGVERHDVGDLLAQRLVVGPVERGLQLGTDPGGHVGEEAPLAAGLADLAGDLGAEDDATLGGGLGAAALLLVAGGHRQQDHVVARARASAS